MSPARLPGRRALAASDFSWRHRVVCVLLAVHVPAIALITVLRGLGPLQAAVQSLLVATLLGLALLPVDRRLKALAASLGLVLSSTLLVRLYDGVPAAHFHYFVVVALLALYQDWAVYVLVSGSVWWEHGLLRAASRHAVFGTDRPWLAALVHALYVGAESAVLVIFWRANEQARTDEETLRFQLSVGQSSVRARVQETDQIRADLIATVSHEFRTPLTGIRGAALTLLKRGDRLDEQGHQRLLTAVLDQQERLSRLLENMLTAARATAADRTALAEVDAVAAEVAMLARAAHPDSPAVSVLVEPGTVACIDRQALHQVLANLIDNAQQHGTTCAVPHLVGGRDDTGVWVTVSNEGRPLDPRQAGRLFEPFTQAASGATRDAEGIGMGLYVVRRLVEVYGGAVAVSSEDGWVTVTVRLQPGQPPLPPDRIELIPRSETAADVRLPL